MKENDKNRYNDIIHLPHHVSRTRPQMTPLERAAQFAPFAALNGYYDAIMETQRLTDKKAQLSETQTEDLNSALNQIARLISEKPIVNMTYFQPDQYKEGGSYISVSCSVLRINPLKQYLTIHDGTQVPFENIRSLEIQQQRNEF